MGNWSFLAEQARFLLLVCMDTMLEKSTGDKKQDLIFKLAKGFRHIEINKELEGLEEEIKAEDISQCILLAHQLAEDKKPLIRAAIALIHAQTRHGEEPVNTLQHIATQDAELAEQLIDYARMLSSEYGWVFSKEVKELAEKLYLDVVPSKKPLEKITSTQNLAQLFIRPDNPFANEAMAIKLMQVLIGKVKDYSENELKQLENKVINLAKTYVTFSCGYSEIPLYQHFDAKLILDLPEPNEWQDELSKDFLIDALAPEESALRKVAFVIRAALASSKDTTGFGQSFTPKAGYRGLKSTQTKRKIGLYTTPESLAGEGAQVSGWLTTLLTKLLRWPGIRANDQGYTWPAELGFNDVEKLLKERLANLKTLYCQLSNMPALPEKISPAWSNDKTDLNVVMVQSKLPKQADFNGDLYLSNPQYRAQHRKHIANVAQLAVNHIAAEDIEADLIIWPELAVHTDDLDVLKQLSQKTHAIIFAGLCFQPLANGKTINTAIWIVPRKHNGNNNEIKRMQGKQHMTALEAGKIQPWRPYQLMLELTHPKFKNEQGFMLTGAICYDATDIKLAADLTNKSNAFVISALNKDVNTFDNMIEALHYHMHQPVVLVNSGEFGGSYAMAPYKEHHDKLIAHTSGKNQITISNFKLNMFDFRRDGVGVSMTSNKIIKAKPAGI